MVVDCCVRHLPKSVATSWNAEVEREVKMVPTGKHDAKGRELFTRVAKTTVFLTGPHGSLAFKVGRGKGGHPVFTDSRENRTGDAPLTNRGPLPGERYTKPGPVRKLTATGWVAEVTRLIGAERARQVAADVA